MKTSLTTILLSLLAGLAGAAETRVFHKPDKITMSAYAEVLIRDQHKLYDTLKKFPAAVISLGGARIKENDPVYGTAEQIGFLLAQSELSGRTGGGPGIMSGVPQGSKRGSLGLIGKVRKTQGISIALPFEQATNPHIDLAETGQTFPYRKLALYKKARGYLTFPGGYGTMDELFQFWDEKLARGNTAPFILVDSPFWRPLIDTLKKVSATHHGLISEREWSEIAVMDQPEEIVAQLKKSKRIERVPSPSVQDRDADALRAGMKTLEDLPPSVAFIGAHSAEHSAAITDAAEQLSAAQITLRVGGPGGVTPAVLRGAKQGEVLGFVRTGNSAEHEGLRVVHKSPDSTVHDVMMSSSLHGIVASPGGLHTLRNVFSILTQIQTHKIERVPVVLVGTAFWRPIFATMKQIMLTDTRRLIAPEDLNLVTITDDPKEIVAAFTKPGRLKDYTNVIK